MSRRAAAAEATRRRIVEAALALHAEQGIGATRWEQIAARAGVGVGTVYRHFPSLHELVPACGVVSRELLALPEPADVPARFAGVESPRSRVGLLVGEAFAVYERGAHVIRAALREPEVHPDVTRFTAAIEAWLSALVNAAADPLDLATEDRRLMRAMVDLGTWTALREQGLTAPETVRAVTAMLACHLERAG